MAVVLVAIAACRSRPKEGGACAAADQVACAGADRALVCESGAWVEVPCKGARGCVRKGASDECDDTIAGEGDACPRSPPLDYACTADRVRALVCNDRKFALWRACRGPRACRIEGGRNVVCDTTRAESGDPCAQQGTYACAPDDKAMLVCDGSAFAIASTCRGARGCSIDKETRKVECDDSVAEEGDACDAPERIACSDNRRAELVCKGKRWMRKRECRRSECRIEGSELFCD